MSIKNIVFDIGNVLVRWDPYKVINSVFPENDPDVFYKLIRPIWLELNLGKITECDAIELYHQIYKIPKHKLEQFMLALKIDQTPISGTVELLDSLCQLNYSLYSITDNIKELLAYHRKHSNFLHRFIDVISSADIGFLKPHPNIYRCLLDRHQLIPQETVFIDDLAINVEGATKLGMHGIQFLDIESCCAELNALGVQCK